MSLLDIFRKKKHPMEPLFEKMAKNIFPGGKSQEIEEMRMIKGILDNKFSETECYGILRSTKALVFLAEDKSFERISGFIHKRTYGRITKDQARQIYNLLMYSDKWHKEAKPVEQVTSMEGRSIEKAIKLSVSNYLFAMATEYKYFDDMSEARHLKYDMKHSLVRVGKSAYDKFDVEWENGSKEEYFFDVSPLVDPAS